MKKNLKVLLTIACALSLCVFALVGCSSSDDSTESADEGSSTEATTEETEDEATTEEASDEYGEGFTLIVGFDSSYPPYGFLDDDGNYTGFDLDLAQAVCDYYGWELDAEPIDWDAKDVLLNEGTINCIWNGFTMEGREDDYTFSDPYMLNEQVVVVKADSDIASLEDLEGATVMTQVDSAALDVLEGDQADLAATFTSLDTIADYNTAFMQLESGAVDAVACDLSIAEYQISANPDAYVMLDEALSSEHYAVGFKLGDEETAEAVNEALIELYEDGTVEELCEKYSDYGLSYDNWVLTGESEE